MRISDWSSDVCSSDLGRHIVFIGHRGHPEVIGTFGQVPPGSMTLVETVADAEALVPADPGNLAFLTQTTLSVDDTAEIVATLERRFPAIEPPRRQDICYATPTRPAAPQVIPAPSHAVHCLRAPHQFISSPPVSAPH